MGCGIAHLKWLCKTGVLKPRSKLLDIGESCLLAASYDDIQWVWDQLGTSLSNVEREEAAKAFSYRSNLRGHPTIQTLFLGEVLQNSTVQYAGIDVVSAQGAFLFDLNRHSLADAKRKAFDLVVNFGTTEHLINQFNAFRVIHEATKPGGWMFHQVPSTGYINHGYFTYDAMMFQELGAANSYELAEMWFTGPQGATDLLTNHTRHKSIRNTDRLENHFAAMDSAPITNSLINVLFRKTSNADFRVGLEIKTAAGGLGSDSEFHNEFIAEPPQPKRSLWARALRRIRGLTQRAIHRTLTGTAR